MIEFETLRYQNILSTGNQFTEIKFNDPGTTLILGENGSGKSTMMDALMFALYGRPYRKINKPQLVNSMTGKNLLVELEFKADGKGYKIRRGIRPNLFEVYKSGRLLKQDAKMSDYQETLEKVLKMNAKSFCQIVMLGSTNYIPFMKLTEHDRRTIIEDLLDIQVFSIMNSLLKEKINLNKQLLLDVDHRVDLLERQIESNERHTESLRVNNQELIASKRSMIDSLNQRIEEANSKIETLTQEADRLLAESDDEKTVSGKKRRILEMEGELEKKRRGLDREIKFFSENDVCPTCRQDIDVEFKGQTLEKRESKRVEIDRALEVIDGKLSVIDSRLEEISRVQEQFRSITHEISVHNLDVRSWCKSIETIREEMEIIEGNTTQVTASERDVKRLRTELKTVERERRELVSEREMLEVSSTMLKDTGIKTRIVRQYVPIINKLVNKYLAALDFFVNFELDERFNETIKSRHRDDFSYASFSEGEKTRIDLSLMMTWRAVAKLRSSASTNLLILDEVFDSALDEVGTEELLKILTTLAGEGTKVIIISHKGQEIHDKFDNVVRFEKHSNFSRIAR